MSKQQYSRLRLVQAISQLPANENLKPKVATGHVWGWRDSMDAPMIIQLPNGIHFACGGITAIERRSAIALGAVGHKVEFYHFGFDIQGKPIDPRFKTLVIDTSKPMLMIGDGHV